MDNQKNDLTATKGAVIRAALAAYFANLPTGDTERTAEQVYNDQNALFAEHQMDKTNCAYYLTEMGKAGQLHYVRCGLVNIYSAQPIRKVPAKTTAKAKAPAAPAPVKLKVQTKNATKLAVDLVKDTGRLRIQLDGMTIEIGVTES